MADTDVIREFLVQLGYKIDEASEKKFSGSIKGATLDALKLGGAVIGVAGAVETFVHEMAKANENLYFMSQRTGAAISNIQGFDYAASQLGSSVDDASSALENMGAFLRYNPGAEGFLNSIHVQTRDVNGALLGTDKILLGVGEQLSKMPPYLQKVYGDYFHFSDKFLRSLTSGDSAKLEEDHLKRLKEAGVDMQKLGAQSHAFEMEWRKLADDTEIFGNKLEQILAGPATGLLKVIDGMITGLEHPIDSGKGLLHALYEAGLPWNAKKTGPGPDHPKWANDALIKAQSEKTLNPFKTFYNMLSSLGAMSQIEDKANSGGDNAQKDITGSSRGIRNYNPGNIKYGPFAKALGASGEDEKGFAIFPDPSAGIAAISSLLTNYAKHGNDTISGIVDRYTKGDSPEVQQAYKETLSRFTGSGLDQHLHQDQDAALREKIVNGIIYQENAGQNPYGNALVDDAVRGKKSTQNIEVNNQNTFHITAPNPQSSADAVAQQMSAITQTNVRNLAAKVI